jgi:glutamate synthase (NADPH/NADH) small chain
MANMSPVKNPMPMQDPDVRRNNFQEVALGLTEEAAVSEAQRCLNCKNRPCVAGCPVNVRIPEFIAKVAQGEFEEAYEIITSTNALPAICGRVCPQENQCEGVCLRGKKGEPVGIGRLERFVADYHMAHGGAKAAQCGGDSAPKGKKVAVVGAGPSGLICSGDLAKMGYEVTLFESLHKAGGVLTYGIPEFRLPKAIVAKEIKTLEDLGVRIVTNAVIGRTLSVDDLFEDGYEAIFIGSGAGLPQFLNIPGENLLGVFSANEYLTRINLMKAYLPEYDTPLKRMKRTAVIGGGNVAMDAARCAMRMGAEEVYVVYRRSMDELPARAEEVHNAIEEGICFKLLNNPVKILGDEKGFVSGLECVQMELGEPDESGRRSPVEIPGSNFVLDVDSVIIAIGTKPNPIIWSTTTGLKGTKKGCLIVDDAMATSREGIYAGGDAVTGAATVILAMGAGKKAAESIDKYLSGK